MKKRILFISFTIAIILTACSRSKQYGVDLLNLEKFNSNLNIETFFQDESIFRGQHNDFYVSSEEHYIDEDSIQMGYIQYSTTISSVARPLASYAGVKFEWLSIIADEADEKALMAIGSTRYATAKDVEKIIDALLSISSMPEMRNERWGNGTNLIVRKGDKVINLYFNIIVESESNEKFFTPEHYSALKSEMQNSEEINCVLFVTNSYFDRAFSAASSSSGDLTRYN